MKDNLKADSMDPRKGVCLMTLMNLINSNVAASSSSRSTTLAGLAESRTKTFMISSGSSQYYLRYPTSPRG